MKYKCDIVKGLILLVKDGSASEENKRVVSEHIDECKSCKNYYGVKKRKSKSKLSITAGVIALLIVQYIILRPIIILFGADALTNLFGEEYSTSNPLDYGKFSGNIEKEKEGRNSYLHIFPQKLSDSAEIKNYYYYSDNKGLFDNTYQIHLECTLSQDDYKQEVKRLSELKMTYKGEVNKVRYDTENFKYPAYVTIYADDFTYEYALVDEENNRIIYVYTWFIYPEDVEFNKEYLPKGFMEEARGMNGYSMYYIKNAGGGGYRIPEE